MGSSSEETNPLEQLRALRSEVIDRERSRMKGLLEEVPPASVEPGVGATSGEGNVPVADDSEPVSDRKPKKAKSVRRNPAIEGDELKIRLGTDLRRLISVQCHSEGWAVNELVTAVLRTALSVRSPAIWHGGTLLASAHVCRFWHRHPMETALRLTSEKGVFLITTNPASALFKHWKEHYTLLGLPDADRMARQMRLIQLQEWVQSVEDFDLADWRKTIAEEDYLVTRAVVSQQEELTEAGTPVEENTPAGGNP